MQLSTSSSRGRCLRQLFLILQFLSRRLGPCFVLAGNLAIGATVAFGLPNLRLTYVLFSKIRVDFTRDIAFGSVQQMLSSAMLPTPLPWPLRVLP